MKKPPIFTVLLLIGASLSVSAPSASHANTVTVFDPKGLSRPDCFEPAGRQPDEVADVPVGHGPHQPMTLRMRTWLPHVAAGAAPGCPAEGSYRAPTIFIHSPYHGYNPTNSEAGYFYGAFFREHLPTEVNDALAYFVARGYAVAASDVRGTGASGGCNEYYGANQARDVAALVDYIKARPWSNGRVGGYGFSFPGIVLNAAVSAAEPAALDTIVTVAAEAGLYDSNAFDGVPWSNGDTGAGVVYFTHQDPPVENPFPAAATQRGCEHVLVEAVSDVSGDMTPFYLEREFRPGVSRVAASVLAVNGLFDVTVFPHGLVGWFDELPTFHRAILGRWDHSEPHRPSRPELARTDYLRVLHAWYDHFLLDLPTGVTSWPVVQVQDANRMWRAVDSLAEMGTATRSFALGSGLGTAGPPGDVREFDEFGVDSLLYWDSAPLQEAVHLSGVARLDLKVSLNREDAHFAVSIYEVRPDGSFGPPARGYQSVRHRDSLTHPSPGPIGRPMSLTIRTIPADLSFAAGSRIRLVVSGYDDGTLPAGSGYTARVHVDGASMLHVPVVQRYDCLRIAQAAPPLAAPPGCEAVFDPL